MSAARALMFLGIVLLSGCSTVEVPSGNVPFAVRAGEVRGCFADIGESASKVVPPILSTHLWPRLPRDERISTIAFDAAADGVLSVRALAGNELVRERLLRSAGGSVGPLVLRHGLWFPPFREESEGEGAPLVGPYGRRVTLGIDAAGDLKLRDESRVVALVYLLIPVAMAESTEFRFRRVPCP